LFFISKPSITRRLSKSCQSIISVKLIK